MVAPVGVGKAATDVAGGASKLGGASAGPAAKGGSGGEHFERMLEDPNKTAEGVAPNQGEAQAVQGEASVASSPSDVTTLKVDAPQAGAPGDKILGGIDKFRQESTHLVEKVERLSETGIGNVSDLSELIPAQASLASFTVTSEAVSKGTGSVSQGIKTLFKGGA